MLYESLAGLVRASGLWDGQRERTHAFLLSPDLFILQPAQAAELQGIGRALQACLGGLARIVAISTTPGLTHGKTWDMIARISRTGIPAYYHELQGLGPNRTPDICKVDFMVDTKGRFQIAEIDGHNKHGLGYSTLAAQARHFLAGDQRSFPGVVTVLVDAIRKRGHNECTLLTADQERFYLPECEILAKALQAAGIALRVVSERELSVGELKLGMLFVDFPFMFKNQDLIAGLVDRYRKGEIAFLIPPKPFLGSKALLALLRNDGQNPELEAILRAHIKAEALDTLRAAIPPTWLVGKRSGELPNPNGNGHRFVLKEAVSSGMKGTIFSDDPRFPTVLASAQRSIFRSVLQEEVENHPFRFRYFSPEGAELEAEWFVRATVHYAQGAIADLIVTARQDRSVHGAKDSLQLGAIVSG